MTICSSKGNFEHSSPFYGYAFFDTVRLSPLKFVELQPFFSFGAS